MKPTLLCVSLVLSLSSTSGTVHWKQWEIQQYHKFFPARALEEERMTVEAAIDTVKGMYSALNESLLKVVDYQRRELQTALMQTATKHDEDCIRGLSTYMDNAVENAMSIYEECTEEVNSRLTRINVRLQSQRNKYNTTYTRTLKDLKYCTDNYANNQDSQILIKKCLNNSESRYFKKAEYIESMYSIEYSPAMKEFKGTVMECIGTAFDSVIGKGYEFLGKMRCCINSTAHQHWHPVENNLQDQIRFAIQQSQFYTGEFETEMKLLYKRLLNVEQLLWYQDEPEVYEGIMGSLLKKYFLAVDTTKAHNPGEWSCVDAAKNALRNITTSGGAKLFNLDKAMRGKTTQQLNDIIQRTETLNNELPSIGNVAILKCFSQGYIFAPNTLRDCFKLTYLHFHILYIENIQAIQEGLINTENYSQYFQDKLNYLPVNFTVQKELLEANRVLHELQRCLYKSSATIYSVTTPSETPSITTPYYLSTNIYKYTSATTGTPYYPTTTTTPSTSTTPTSTTTTTPPPTTTTPPNTTTQTITTTTTPPPYDYDYTFDYHPISLRPGS